MSARPDGLALLALAGGAVCIALSPIFVRLSEAGPTATAFWRVALAVPLLWLVLWAAPRAAPAAAPAVRLWPLYASAGLAFAGDLAFWHASIQYTSVANSTLLANLASIFVTVALWLIWRERPSRLFLAGLATALAGTALLVRASVDVSPTALYGDGLGVITAVFYAWYILVVKRLRDSGVGVLPLMAVTSLVTAGLLLPLALVSGETLLPASATGWAMLVGLAWISHAAGQGLIAYALAHLRAGFSSVGLLLQPAMAALFAWLLLAEPLSALQAAGGLVVLAGIWLARRGSST